jgi:hypothetical protein
MISDDEMRDRVLGLLEEAGENNAYSLLNMTEKPSNDIRMVHALARVLLHLQKTGLANIGLESPFPSNVQWLTLDALGPVLDVLPTRFAFDHASGNWTMPGAPPHKQTLLYVGLTKRGMEKAVEVMTAHGGIWWTTKT